MGVPTIPAKILIFEEILKGTFQLSVEHSIFDLEFMSVCVAALLFLNQTRSSKEHHGSPYDGSVKSAGPHCCHI